VSCKGCGPKLDRGEIFSSESAFIAELSRVKGDLEAGRATLVESGPFELIFDCANCFQRWELVFPDWPKAGWLRKISQEAVRLEELRSKFRGG